MDAQALAQGKALATKSLSSATSIEVALPSGKAVQAKVTQVTQLNPDQAQQSTHRVKLEVNNTVIQLSAKFSANIPEAGSSVIVQRSNDGQIQLKVIADNQTTNKSIDSKPVANTTSNQTVNNQATDKTIINAKALLANITTTSSPLTASGDSGKVILKAPVIINASGSTLSAIELALPKGETLTARVISQNSSLLNNASANTSSVPLGNSQNIATATNATSVQPSNSLTNTAIQTNSNVTSNVNSTQPPSILNNSLTNNTQAATVTSPISQTTGANTNATAIINQTSPNTARPSQNPITNTPTDARAVTSQPASVVKGTQPNNTSNTYSARATPAPLANLPTDAKALTSQPASVVTSTQPNSTSNTYNSRPTPIPATVANLPTDAKAVTTQSASNITNTQSHPGTFQQASLQNAVKSPNLAQPVATLANNTNNQSAPTSSSPVVPQAPQAPQAPQVPPSQNRVNATLPTANLSNNVAATASPTLSPTIPTTTPSVSTPSTLAATTTAAVNQTANPTSASNTAVNSNIGTIQNTNSINSHSVPTSSISAPQTTSSVNQQNPGIKATVTVPSSQPSTGAPNTSPLLPSQTHSQPTSIPSSPQALSTNTSADTFTNRQNIPQNLQLNALPSNNAAIKIAVAGQSITLQAPANLPPLQSVQITRTEGVQANIQWQQVSQTPTPQVTPPILSPKQVQLMEHSLRQALPQQIPIADGINQLVNQTALFASIASPAQASVDKITMSIMQLFGVKPGANNSSDTVKRNIQQGGLFTESKLVSQSGGQQGDMKNFLAKLNRLAEQLPTEQKEMLQNTTERMLARVTTNQLSHVQQQHLKADISNERSFQIDIPVQHNEKLDNVEIEIKQRKHLNDEGDFVAIWSVKLHFDLEERGEVDAEVALNPTDNTISTTFLCTQLSTVHEIEQRMNNFKNQLNSQGFEVQTLHCSQGSQAAIANNPISKRIIDIRT